MKRLSILLLLGMTGVSALQAAGPKATPVPPIFINDQPITPPEIPPQVDAAMFINRSLFVVSNDFLFTPLVATPYEAQSVRFWTNSGVMFGAPGFIFNYTPNPAHLTPKQRRTKGALLPQPSRVFDNSGQISVTDTLQINADRINNSGVLSGDANARIKFLSKTGLVDLSFGAVRIGQTPITSCVSSSNFFLFDDQSVVYNYNFISSGTSGFITTNRSLLCLPSLTTGTNSTLVPCRFNSSTAVFAAPNPVPPPAQYALLTSRFPGAPATNRVTNILTSLAGCGSYGSFMHITTNFVFDPILGPVSVGRDISVVFVPTNGLSDNVSVGVAFPTNGRTPIVEFRSAFTDVIQQSAATAYITYRDDGTTVFHGRDCDFDLSDPPNTPFSSDIFYQTNFVTNAVNYFYTVASVHVGNTNSIYFTNDPAAAFLTFPRLGQSPAATDPTNRPGHIEINSKVLDLSHTRLQAENGIFIRTTNLVGIDSATLDTPFVSFDAATTNQSLVLSNFVHPQVSRPQADFNSWAGSWTVGNITGTTVIGTNVFFTTEPLTYHVLILGACVNASAPTVMHRLTLHATNTVIEDKLAINASAVFEGNSVTIGSNGSLTLPLGANLAFTNFQGVLNFTNFGVLNVPDGAFFGIFEDGYVSPPIKKLTRKQLKQPQPPRLLTYESVVNHGQIAAASTKVRAGYVEVSGSESAPATILGSNGVVTLEGATLILSNAFIDARSDLRLTAGSLLATRTVLDAGATTGGVLQAFIPGPLIIDATNSLTDGGVAASNVWRVTGGVRMVRRPAEPGDLLGTTLTSLAGTFVQSVHTWAGVDRGATAEGYTNNLALGRLVLDGATGTQFRFQGVDADSALYVDYLELRNFPTNYNLAVAIAPGFRIYFANANIAPDKLDPTNSGPLRWVPTYAGAQSSTNILYPNGITYTFNTALVRRGDLDSDGDNIQNADDCTPISVADFNSATNNQCVVLLPAPLAAVRVKSSGGSMSGGSSLDLRIALAPVGGEVVLRWNAPANSANTVEFTESLGGGTWQSLTNFINGSVDARVTARDAAAAPQRVYRVRVDASKP